MELLHGGEGHVRDVAEQRVVHHAQQHRRRARARLVGGRAGGGDGDEGEHDQEGCQKAFHAPTVLPRSSARRERSSSMRRPSSRPMRGAQPSNSLARVMSGRRCLGSFAGSAS